MALTLVSCKIPAAETPVVGVTLDPYVLVRRGDSGVTATAEEVPEEGHSDARFSLRFRYLGCLLPFTNFRAFKLLPKLFYSQLKKRATN